MYIENIDAWQFHYKMRTTGNYLKDLLIIFNFFRLVLMGINSHHPTVSFPFKNCFFFYFQYFEEEKKTKAL